MGTQGYRKFLGMILPRGPKKVSDPQKQVADSHSSETLFPYSPSAFGPSSFMVFAALPSSDEYKEAA